MSELFNELTERLDQTEKKYKMLERRGVLTDPLHKRTIENYRDLKICVDALSYVDSDLEDLPKLGSDDDDDGPAEPQRVLSRKKPALER